jgi:hypothetical protein
VHTTRQCGIRALHQRISQCLYLSNCYGGLQARRRYLGWFCVVCLSLRQHLPTVHTVRGVGACPCQSRRHRVRRHADVRAWLLSGCASVQAVCCRYFQQRHQRGCVLRRSRGPIRGLRRTDICLALRCRIVQFGPGCSCVHAMHIWQEWQLRYGPRCRVATTVSPQQFVHAGGVSDQLCVPIGLLRRCRCRRQSELHCVFQRGQLHRRGYHASADGPAAWLLAQVEFGQPPLRCLLQPRVSR